jgi:hypothetical protein
LASVVIHYYLLCWDVTLSQDLGPFLTNTTGAALQASPPLRVVIGPLRRLQAIPPNRDLLKNLLECRRVAVIERARVRVSLRVGLSGRFVA